MKRQFLWDKYFPWYFAGDLIITGCLFVFIAWLIS